MSDYCIRANDEGTLIDDNIETFDIIAIIGVISAVDLNLSSNQIRERHLRLISRAIIHHEFQKSKNGDEIPKGPDIALLKLERPLPK